uniref:Uncharacterized protein n=1 Tax=Chromera velia CCMP2878 TaxID=1169474 RepID=A0A0G4HMP6_9ALVE|eukprot:Cvel_7520.t1-p1 / transcript=Cvel_7520.t1 / gene=Cvel_7520 / organism=Chromera_velia_CCMP2878 / gene_product=hypothetical protein / transcript_product=hypothetical protein / location=Cvel_scaffold395:26726-29114(-) / protein_length=547 / sequence_SO=supercontig / SO=protein_coding / is_pseudo=false
MHPLLTGLIALWPFAVGSLTPFISLLMLSLANVIKTSILWPLLINYGTALVLCFPLAFSGPPIREVASNLKTRLESSPADYFSLFAGIVSAGGIGIGAYCSGRIGFGVTYVTATCVMVVLSALIDACGLLWAVKRRLRVVDYVSIVLVISGTAVWVFDSDGRKGLAVGAALSPVEYGGTVILAAVGAASLLASGPFNKRLTQSTGNTFRTTVFCSAVACCGIVIVASGVNPRPRWDLVVARDWWKFFPGVMGFCMLLTSQTAPRWIGFALSNRARVAGNIVGALVLDSLRVGLNGRPHEEGHKVMSPGVATGFGLVMLGLVISLQPPPPPHKPPSPSPSPSSSAEVYPPSGEAGDVEEGRAGGFSAAETDNGVEFGGQEKQGMDTDSEQIQKVAACCFTPRSLSLSRQGGHHTEGVPSSSEKRASEKGEEGDEKAVKPPVVDSLKKGTKGESDPLPPPSTRSTAAVAGNAPVPPPAVALQPQPSERLPPAGDPPSSSSSYEDYRGNLNVSAAAASESTVSRSPPHEENLHGSSSAPASASGETSGGS